jgi:2'-5' RNA ligase
MSKKFYNRPTHFVALRIKNENIWKKTNDLQEKMMSNFKSHEKYKIPASQLHLTVFVLTLKNENEIKNAKDSLKKCQTILNELQKIKMKGVGTFNKKVIFAKINEEEYLKKVFKNIYDVFKDNGSSPNELTTSVHATLFKLSKVREENGLKAFQNDFYNLDEYLNYEFGEHDFDTLELNCMKFDGDYYKEEANIQKNEN